MCFACTMMTKIENSQQSGFSPHSDRCKFDLDLQVDDDDAKYTDTKPNNEREKLRNVSSAPFFRFMFPRSKFARQIQLYAVACYRIFC